MMHSERIRETAQDVLSVATVRSSSIITNESIKTNRNNDVFEHSAWRQIKPSRSNADENTVPSNYKRKTLKQLSIYYFGDLRFEIYWRYFASCYLRKIICALCSSLLAQQPFSVTCKYVLVIITTVKINDNSLLIDIYIYITVRRDQLGPMGFSCIRAMSVP